MKKARAAGASRPAGRLGGVTRPTRQALARPSTQAHGGREQPAGRRHSQPKAAIRPAATEAHGPTSKEQANSTGQIRFAYSLCTYYLIPCFLS